VNILIINWQDKKNPFAGGAEIYLFEIFSRIARAGHKVTLFCSSYENAPTNENIEGIEVIRKGGRHTFNFTVLTELQRLIRSNSFDIVIDDLNKIPFYTPLFVNKPTMALLMHLFRKSIYKEALFPFATYVYLTETLISIAYRKTNIVVLSESSKKDLLNLGIKGERIEVIPPCIDNEKCIPDPNKKEASLIAHVGRIKKYKCIDHLLYAAKILKDRGKSFEIAIAGKGDDLPRLIGISKKLSLEDCVEFKGFVSEEEKIRIYQSASFLIENSVKEGWGIIVLEANACGTPVIAANSPGLIDSVVNGKTGSLYNYGDIKDLANKMERMLDSKPEREEMARNARTWAEKFSWDTASKKMFQIIKRSVDEYHCQTRRKAWKYENPY